MIAAALLSSCSSIPLNTGASQVIVSPNPVPKGCVYKGQVVGNQGNFFTGDWTSNKNLEEGALNDMKNQAHNAGANYVQLITNRAGNTGSANSGWEQTSVTNSGNAYSCPAKAIGLSN